MRGRAGIILFILLIAPGLPAFAQDHDHSAHTAPAASEQSPSPEPLPSFIPPLTDADRAAASPDVDGHAVHDTAINYFVLFDQFEWQSGSGADAFSWDTKGWIGQDIHRFWFRTEGDRAGGRTEQAQTHLLYGRAIARWWDVTAGVRVDTLPSTPRTALALGVQGLAPYWFEVEASAYIEPSGRTHVRIETEYELLITNRLVLQPLVEFEVYGRADPERHIGAGLSTADVGLRLRYEFKRELAPYIGVVWNRKFFGTADRARAADHTVNDARFVAGLRWWM
ncbi:MAG: copper resistance protein B [Acidobacteria bacterium]|nr:copper resistance protein B [Acidobacteriota bacterium]